MSSLRALHATRNAAGLSEEDARDIYERMVAKRSTRTMNAAELTSCRNEIIRLYPKAGERASKGVQSPVKASSARSLSGRYAGKFQALWIAAWNLGVTRDRSDAALTAFVKRQTHIDHTRWLTHAGDATKVIEALKAWMTRKACVDWSAPSRYALPYCSQDGFRIAHAQWRMLRCEDAAEDNFFADVRQRFGLSAYPNGLTREDWQSVMNGYGPLVRQLKQHDEEKGNAGSH